ncbi:SMC family ATPase [Streptomyces sp. HSG2]|uniref:AAA family ATPase n=1 Tax=Streptomyces sp. HSG2 TaxID=2797167 RepID=UPI00190811A3|nr:SMC family ATPase [Streptomyces sp. HSG2]
MRLHRLEITAFGPFGGHQTVDFDSLSAAGLFLLHGPTGAGKTSVLDAVCHALYGSPPGARQGHQAAHLRSDHAAPGVRTEVRLELTVAGRRLEITRRPPWERRKTRGSGTTVDKAQTWLREYDAEAGRWRDLSRSHQEVGEEVVSLLGMSRDQFCQVVLLPQGDFARFLRSDAEARGKLLGRLFDTGRFADVERHLVDLRRAAEGRVTEGDTALIADAHRMRQAAGGAMWLPELSPGDPGLAEEILAAAAIARTTLRERLAVARSRLRIAEAAEASAERELALVRERHRLQGEYAHARERAEKLAERAEAYHEDQRRLERAHQAGTVRPALALRATAEAEHRRAAAAEADARTRLPARYAEADAASLAAAARRTAEELGALDAARRAEDRLAELLVERADLDRAEDADHALLTETRDRLAGWSKRHESLLRRVDTAREAADRVDRLADRSEDTLIRLTAAVRRDELAVECEALARAALDSAERASEAKRHWLDLKERRLEGIAAELAATLAPGCPCPVCGAAEHPAPAPRGTGHVDRAGEEAALSAHQAAEDRHVADRRRLALLREELASASATAGDAPRERLAAEAEELRALLARTRDEAADLPSAREETLRSERRREQHEAGLREVALRSASRSARRERLEQERAVLEEELARARGEAESVSARASRLETSVGWLSEAAESTRVAEEAAERLKDADAGLADAAYRAGFDTPGDVVGALLDDADRRVLRDRSEEWRREEAAVRLVLTDEATALAASHPPVDPAEAELGAARARRRAREAASAHDAADRCRAELDTLSARASEAVRALAPLRREHDRVARVASLVAGTSADNVRRMRLETYVLAARLEQVAAAAGARLLRMSAGRYTLVHSDDRTGRGRSGLGLRVVDAWTGRERDTSTLSGGETFFASLSLALGLADVVTDEAGGVRLDTLFIDEGFGSLDEETLDEVLDVLDSLRERDRSVGIVSHVPDLRRRVHARLEVVKGRSGSELRRRGPGR